METSCPAQRNLEQLVARGYQINPPVSAVPSEWLAASRDMPSAIVSDCLGRDVGGLGLKPFHGGKHLCGSALTVRVQPGDNLLTLKAIQMARPGDVLVIDGSGDMTRAVFGGIMRAMALKAAIAGVVINGAIRDHDECLDGQFPVFALGCVHRVPSTDGSGEINAPIFCAGLVVCLGDLVIGDLDGVIAVPQAELPALHERCLQLLDRERSIMAAITASTLDPSRFDELLRSKGCPL